MSIRAGLLVLLMFAHSAAANQQLQQVLFKNSLPFDALYDVFGGFDNQPSVYVGYNHSRSAWLPTDKASTNVRFYLFPKTGDTSKIILIECGDLSTLKSHVALLLKKGTKIICTITK